MKNSLLTFAVPAVWALFLTGCEKDENDEYSRCHQLVDHTIDCYEEVVGRAPSAQEVDDWRADCEVKTHSNSCLNCAMEQPCADYIQNPDYVFHDLCADHCGPRR